MMQDWHSEYELLKPLEKYYRLLIPAMDGFYDGSSDFTDFADQSKQIEEYIKANYGGEIYGAYGASQGGLMLTELLTRNNIKIQSVENEAQQIEDYICKENIKTVFALCGLSMGGVIAHKIFERNKLQIENLILDGAPLVKMSFIAEKAMTGAYKSIIHKSKLRDRKTLDNFKRDFLPERYLESYLKFADTMSDTTIENMLHSVCAGDFTPAVNLDSTRILYMHGTKGNEVYSIKSVKKMKKHYTNLEAVEMSQMTM